MSDVTYRYYTDYHSNDSYVAIRRQSAIKVKGQKNLIINIKTVDGNIISRVSWRKGKAMVQPFVLGRFGAWEEI
jgi:hypothetical protein